MIKAKKNCYRKKINHKSHSLIFCIKCALPFEASFFETFQAYRCSSFITNKNNNRFSKISCHYGSSFDGDIFIIDTQKTILQHNSDQPICDFCIKDLIIDGRAIFINPTFNDVNYYKNIPSKNEILNLNNQSDENIADFFQKYKKNYYINQSTKSETTNSIYLKELFQKYKKLT